MVLAVPCNFRCLKFLGSQRKTLWNPGKRVYGAERRRRWTSTRAAASGSDSDLSRLIEAAKLTVDTYIKSGMVLGLGSGRASGMVIRYLGQQLREGALKDIVGVPTSVSSASEAAKAGIPLNHYADSSQIDFAFDDADVIEEGTLNAIIGRQKLVGCESILKEKSIVKAAGKRAFIVSEEQYTKDFDGSIPVLVNPVNWMETAEEIDDLFLGDAELFLKISLFSSYFEGLEETNNRACWTIRSSGSRKFRQD